ncbi:FAD-dependent oxidoreductase [Shouchella lehensis]|uniref:Flavin-dependent monooxygenase n=1 Tax=Shouchella lehensis TaxID=300825 RepID=A0A4Y7WLA8_9BACI|nr:NAD(P)/FAD-dependent oxidoreductase [Shouchella lehensis]MBG9783339.1 tetracycline resistance protein [Shouchella lehensis]TES49280.1 FAD-dependent monooxygenase [Shouchella lehensis]
MTNPSYRIAIIGAGLGGLTLAKILQNAGYTPVLYEGEASRYVRPQGGTLDLETHTGQRALELAGLIDLFYEVCRFEGQSSKTVDKNGKVYHEDHDLLPTAEETSRPEIDRTELRDLLLDSLQADTIRWGHKCTGAVPIDDTRYELYFENGHTDVVDLVVGADGAFSRIRPLVSDEKAKYSGVSMVELNITNAEELFPELVAYNGPGTVYALSDHKAIIAQMNGDGRIRVYLGFKAEVSFLEALKLSHKEPEIAKQTLLNLFSDWSNDLKQYIICANGEITPRRIYMLPVAHKWENKKGVTLIGDAAHLMSPFAGAGANLAMLDGAELALSIIHTDNHERASREYEKRMFEYARKASSETKENVDLFFSEGAAAKLGALMNSFQE